MKKRIIHLVVLAGLLYHGVCAQQQFVQTVTTRNTGCNTHCSIIDALEFTNNPGALIFATPATGNTANSSSNLIGALYRTSEKRWSIYNLNGAPMTAGTTFNIESYPNTDNNHFVFIVPPKIRSSETVYIDHEGLNNNPDARIRIFPTNPTAGNAVFNVYETQVTYATSAGKWIIANKDGTDMPSGVAYNVMFSDGGPSVVNNNTGKILNTDPKTPVSIMPECNCVIPTSLPPNGPAGGDLAGTFPYPKVTGLQGKPMSADSPSPGQVLKWNGSAWEPANENGSSGTTYNAGTGLAIQGSTIYANNIGAMWNANKLMGNAVSNSAPTIGQVLKWNGTVWEPGTDNIGTSNNSQTSGSAKTSVLFFNQILDVVIEDPNINSATIPGLNNRAFTITQNSHAVYNTVVTVMNTHSIITTLERGPVDVFLNVTILNSLNQQVGYAYGTASVQFDQKARINAVGLVILPPGTYHTSVSVGREIGGHRIEVIGSDSPGGTSPTGTLMILEIIPD